MKFVISNQKFFRNHPVSLQELLSFRQNCPEKFFIRLLTAKMSTINLCKMQKAPAGNCKGCSARRGLPECYFSIIVVAAAGNDFQQTIPDTVHQPVGIVNTAAPQSGFPVL